MTRVSSYSAQIDVPLRPIKAVQAIREKAEYDYNIKPKIIGLIRCKEIQNKSPCTFETFCLVYNGKAIADHPTGNTRFKNIVNRVLQ